MNNLKLKGRMGAVFKMFKFDWIETLVFRVSLGGVAMSAAGVRMCLEPMGRIRTPSKR